jgi:hypothetical protein
VETLRVLVGAIVLIGGIVAAAGIAIYALRWFTLLAIRRVPMIGERHRHPGWDRLNRP